MKIVFNRQEIINCVTPLMCAASGSRSSIAAVEGILFEAEVPSTVTMTTYDLEKGVRAIVFKRKAGFRVTVGTKRANKTTGKGEAGFHTNRQGLKKPILIWAEGGTEERQTKPKQGTRRRAARLRQQHRTGRMRRYGFMEQTLNSVRDTVTQDIHAMVVDNVTKVAGQHGWR